MPENVYFGVLTDKAVDPEKFYMHNHNAIEIFMFLKGDAVFNVEGNIYNLSPYDTIIVRNNEMHMVQHKSICEYKRISLHINQKFFEEMNCQRYLSVFFDRQWGKYNKISGQRAYQAGLYDALMRVDKYLKLQQTPDEIVFKCAVVEVLYLINALKPDISGESQGEKIRDILNYINSNLTCPITLEDIASRFSLSKHYLCRMFKSSVGHTIIDYINFKRLILVRDLCKRGFSIGEASLKAGFGSYSNFYRTYIKEYGKAPSKDLFN